DGLLHSFELDRPGIARRELGERLERGAATEDLPAARRRPDPRGRVDAPAAEVPLALERPVGVDPDPDVEGEVPIGGTLYGDRRLDRRLRILERDEEAVAGVVDDLAVVLPEDPPQRLVVAAHDVRPVAILDHAREVCRLDDVREDE